jgi:hypothetical protein
LAAGAIKKGAELTGHRFGRGVAAVACLVALAGCSSGSGASPGSDGLAVFKASASQALTEANAAGASDAQVQIIQRAIDTGEVTFEDASRAVDSFAACVNGAGGTVTTQVDVTDTGFQVPSYSAVVGSGGLVDDPGAENIVTACDAREDYWVNYLYQMQPAALRASEVDFDAHRGALIACLREHGVAVADDVTNDELKRADSQLTRDKIGDPEFMPCAAEVGIRNY